MMTHALNQFCDWRNCLSTFEHFISIKDFTFIALSIISLMRFEREIKYIASREHIEFIIFVSWILNENTLNDLDVVTRSHELNAITIVLCHSTYFALSVVLLIIISIFCSRSHLIAKIEVDDYARHIVWEHWNVHIDESKENREKEKFKNVEMIDQLYYVVDAIDEQHNCWENKLLLLFRELITCVRCKIFITLIKSMSHDCQAHEQISTITKLNIEVLKLL